MRLVPHSLRVDGTSLFAAAKVLAVFCKAAESSSSQWMVWLMLADLFHDTVTLWTMSPSLVLMWSQTTVTRISHTTRRASRSEGQNQIVTKPYSMECFSINTRRLHRTSSTSPTQLCFWSMPTMMLGVHRILPQISRQITTIDLEEGWREGRRALCVHRTVIIHLPRCQSCVTRRGVTRILPPDVSKSIFPSLAGCTWVRGSNRHLFAPRRCAQELATSSRYSFVSQTSTTFSASQHACPSAGVLANS